MTGDLIDGIARPPFPPLPPNLHPQPLEPTHKPSELEVPFVILLGATNAICVPHSGLYNEQESDD